MQLKMQIYIGPSGDSMNKIFNLSQDEINYAKNKEEFCLVIYDISDDKRRNDLSKILDGYGQRVQRSCYEMKLEHYEYENLIIDIEKFYNKKEDDNIIVYRAIESQVENFNTLNEREFSNGLIFL